MATEHLEKLLLKVLMNQAMLRADVAELQSQLSNTAGLVEGGDRVETYTQEMDLLMMMMRTAGLAHHWDWLVRSQFPEQAG